MTYSADFQSDFGAVADGNMLGGTDNSSALDDAVTELNSSLGILEVGPGYYYFDSSKFTLTKPCTIRGVKGRTFFVFGGNPTKEVVTRVIWRSEYDTGDFTNNSDAAVSWAIRVNSQNVVLEDITIIPSYNPSAVYPLPFSSSTDYPTTNYDYGVLWQKPKGFAVRLDVLGVWANSSFCVDGSNVGGFGDGLKVFGGNFSGLWGLKIIGASGKPNGGHDALDLTSLDIRCAAGISDIEFYGCNFYDTSGSVRLNIGSSTNKLVRRASGTGGAVYINGQVSANSAKRIQGIRFFGGRWASSDPYVGRINYANRIEMHGVHTEWRSGALNTDGVTPLVASNCQLLTTKNARNLLFVGGEKSGETDNRVMFADDGTRIVTEMGYELSERRMVVASGGID